MGVIGRIYATYIVIKPAGSRVGPIQYFRVYIQDTIGGYVRQRSQQKIGF